MGAGSNSHVQLILVQQVILLSAIKLQALLQTDAGLHSNVQLIPVQQVLLLQTQTCCTGGGVQTQPAYFPKIISSQS